MNRIKILVIGGFILLTIAGLAACVWAVARPTPNPILNPDYIHTSVYGTLTAMYVSPTLTSTTQGTITVTLPPVSNPHDFIFFYFNNINARAYDFTWTLLTERFKDRLNGAAQGGYAGYVAFWNSVQKVTVLNAFYLCEGDVCAVTTTLTLLYTNGASDISVYDYTVIFDHARNTWMFDFVPAPTATASGTFTATMTRTSTSTSTATRTGTATSTSTATNTATWTASPTLTATPTATYTASMTPTASPTATLTPTQTGTQPTTP